MVQDELQIHQSIQNKSEISIIRQNGRSYSVSHMSMPKLNQYSKRNWGLVRLDPRSLIQDQERTKEEKSIKQLRLYVLNEGSPVLTVGLCCGSYRIQPLTFKHMKITHLEQAKISASQYYLRTLHYDPAFHY